MLPALPLVAAPVTIEIKPLLPTLDVPDVKDSFPLTPELPALLVCTTKSPLDRSVPRPVVNEIAPPDPVPLAPVLSPARTITSPPVSVGSMLSVPGDTLSTMLPPLPFVAVPVANVIDPDAPRLVVPDVNESAPLTPDVPAFTVFITMPPLDDEVPSPDDNDNAPPVIDAPAPAVTDTAPPSAAVDELASPATMYSPPPTAL